MKFDKQIHVEEMEGSQVFPTPIPDDVEIQNYISEHILLTVTMKDGKLLGVTGKKIHARIVEMNHVMIIEDDEVVFRPLGDELRWLEVE